MYVRRPAGFLHFVQCMNNLIISYCCKAATFYWTAKTDAVILGLRDMATSVHIDAEKPDDVLRIFVVFGIVGIERSLGFEK